MALAAAGVPVFPRLRVFAPRPPLTRLSPELPPSGSCYDGVVFPRFAHIERSRQASDGTRKYRIHDANRYGDEESGFTQPFLVLSHDEASNWLASEGVPQPEIDALLQLVDRQGSTSVRLKARIGPRIVRAWFDTVINPLIASLEMELTLAGKGNWTWRFRPPTLELIRQARRYLEPAAAASLEQISRLEPETKATIRPHDDSVDLVFNSAAGLHNGLTSARTFIDLCDSLWGPIALAATGIHDIRDIFGGYVPEERYDLIAQYMVNNTGELPSYYATSKFWNWHRTTLMETLNQPEIRPRHDSLLQAGERLEGASRDLLRRLEDLRLVLSLDHDVPYVVGSPADAVL